MIYQYKYQYQITTKDKFVKTILGKYFHGCLNNAIAAFMIACNSNEKCHEAHAFISFVIVQYKELLIATLKLTFLFYVLKSKVVLNTN